MASLTPVLSWTPNPLCHRALLNLTSCMFLNPLVGSRHSASGHCLSPLDDGALPGLPAPPWLPLSVLNTASQHLFKRVACLKPSVASYRPRDSNAKTLRMASGGPSGLGAACCPLTPTREPSRAPDSRGPPATGPVHVCLCSRIPCRRSCLRLAGGPSGTRPSWTPPAVSIHSGTSVTGWQGQRVAVLATIPACGTESDFHTRLLRECEDHSTREGTPVPKCMLAFGGSG